MRRSLSFLFFGTVTLFTLCSAQTVFAQHANIWYFGDEAGLDFNNGAPVPITNGSMIAFEGCATIADETGDLLFYTNGGPVMPAPYDVGGVWDATHGLMPNGDLNTDRGCNSAQQGSLIVQDPGNDAHYYVFTVDCIENQFEGGLRYFEVDMTLEGGLGDVVAASVPLLSGVNESILGIRHANGTDVWLLLHGAPGTPNNGKYYTFLVTAAGISGPDSVSIGPSINIAGGQMTANRLGTRVHYGAGSSSLLFNFDPATGVLSDPLDLQRSGILGCMFAGGGQFLYTSETAGLARIFQYDLFAENILTSEQVIGESNWSQTGMQLGPDGKIYISRGNKLYLGVIAYPDSAGVSAGYVEEGLYLGGRKSLYALPNFVNDLLFSSPVGMGEEVHPLAVRCLVVGENLCIQAAPEDGSGTFSVFRSDGAMVLNDLLTGTNTQVPLARIGKGVRIVRVTSNEGRMATTKVVIAQ